MIEIYTDGSNVHNGKPYSYGGYGYVIKYKDNIIENGNSMPINNKKPVTNNRAELMAIIDSMNYISKLVDEIPDKVIIYSDSQWCVKCANGEWARKKNIDLWAKFNKIKGAYNLYQIKLEIKWVKGHVGIELNELADKIAGEYCKLAKDMKPL